MADSATTEDPSSLPNGAGILIGMALVVVIVVLCLCITLCYADQWKYRAYLVKCFGETCGNTTCDICCMCCKPPPKEEDKSKCNCPEAGCSCATGICDCSQCKCPNCPKFVDPNQSQPTSSQACIISETET